MSSLASALTYLKEKVGTSWALAFAFTMLLGYAAFLQISNASAAPMERVVLLEDRVAADEAVNIETHARVAATLDLLLQEVRELRADLRAR